VIKEVYRHMPMNSERLVQRQPLPNGLTLEFWDHSRPIAADRWYALMETRIIIPVRKYLPPDLKPQVDRVVEALGEEVVFSRQEERNFIAAAEASDIIKEMQDRMLQLAPGYFGHQDFPGKFIRKTYLAWQNRQAEEGAEQS
jgi:hypothetical protein